LETSFLQTFVLVVETGSKAEAARRLNLTQGAVDQQIRALEREFGTSLIARAGRTVQPTDSGLRVVGGMREALKNIHNLRDLANADSLAGELKLGTINTALLADLPDMLKRLIRRHPQVKVNIHPGSSSMELYDAVQRGDIDAAICIHPRFTLPKTVAWRLMREEPLIMLAPLHLAKRDPHELLRTEPFIRYGRTQWGGRQAQQYLRSAGIVPSERFELSSLAAIALMVDRGLGVSLVPDAGLPLPSGLKLAKLKLPMRSEVRRIGMLWLRSSIRLRLIKLLSETIE
jgi:DNA-binding transcriptional LysR family regulator